jgi:hypothetical protein
MLLLVLNAMAKLLQANIIIAMIVCPPAWNNSAPFKGLKKIISRPVTKTSLYYSSYLNSDQNKTHYMVTEEIL